MWEPQPLTTLRASKACRGENFTFTFLIFGMGPSCYKHVTERMVRADITCMQRQSCSSTRQLHLNRAHYEAVDRVFKTLELYCLNLRVHFAVMYTVF
jgi:hypothetical protein